MGAGDKRKTGDGGRDADGGRLAVGGCAGRARLARREKGGRGRGAGGRLTRMNARESVLRVPADVSHRSIRQVDSQRAVGPGGEHTKPRKRPRSSSERAPHETPSFTL